MRGVSIWGCLLVFRFLWQGDILWDEERLWETEWFVWLTEERKWDLYFFKYVGLSVYLMEIVWSAKKRGLRVKNLSIGSRFYWIWKGCLSLYVSALPFKLFGVHSVCRSDIVGGVEEFHFSGMHLLAAFTRCSAKDLRYEEWGTEELCKRYCAGVKSNV